MMECDSTDEFLIKSEHDTPIKEEPTDQSKSPENSMFKETIFEDSNDSFSHDSDLSDSNFTFIGPPSRRQNLSTRKRKELNLKEKIELINQSAKQSHRSLAKIYNISKTQVGSILKRKTEYLDYYKKNANFPRKRIGLCGKDTDGFRQNLENYLTKWIEDCLVKKIPVSGPRLQQKALHYAQQNNHPEFKASNGWLCCFKIRNNVVFSKSPKFFMTSSKSNKNSEIVLLPQLEIDLAECQKTEADCSDDMGDKIGSVISSIVHQQNDSSQIEEKSNLDGSGILSYMKYCDSDATKKLEESIKSDLNEAEDGLQKLMELNKEAGSKLQKVVDERLQKTVLLQQKLAEVANLKCEINLLETEEQHLISNKEEVLDKISFVGEKVKSCGKALDDLHVIQEGKTFHSYQ